MTYATRITALPPSAWLTSGTKDGVKKLSMPEASTNFSYVKAHRAWDWAPMVFVAVAEAIATEADAELSALRGRVEELERHLSYWLPNKCPFPDQPNDIICQSHNRHWLDARAAISKGKKAGATA